MGARGRFAGKRKTKSNNKNRSSKKKHVKRPTKQRKTYSIHNVTKNANKPPKETKRKFEVRAADIEIKRPKIQEPEIGSDSESEEEIVEHMKQLQDTFKAQKKTSLAIDSSDDSSSDEDQADVQEETSISEAQQNSEDDSNEEELVTVSRRQDVSVQEEENNVEQEIQDIEDESQKEEEEEDENVGKETQDAEDDSLEDPFSNHLSYDLSSSLLSSIQSVPVVVDNFTENWPCLGKFLVHIPQCEEITPASKNSFSIAAEQRYAAPGKQPTILDVKLSKINDTCIKSQIINNIAKANHSLTNSVAKDGLLTPFQSEVFSVINSYQDFFYPHRTFDNAEALRFVYCLHVTNHILKTRMKILHHNARLSKKDDVPEEFRDQGLVRPKVYLHF